MIGITNFSITGRRNEKRHADLIDRKKCGVGREFTYCPGQFNETGNDVRQRSHQCEHRILARHPLDDAADNRIAEWSEISGQRQFDVLVRVQDVAHGKFGIAGLKYEAVAPGNGSWSCNREIERSRRGYIAHAMQTSKSLGAFIGALAPWREIVLHRGIRFGIVSGQTYVQLTACLSAHPVRIEIGVSSPDIFQ